LLALGLFLGFLTAVGHGGDWPQFRGPNGSATTAETGLPAEWGPDKNVAWKVKLPGYGWSSPVVWGDKVFVTTAVSDKQQKPTSLFGPSGPGGGPGRPGGPGAGPGRLGGPPLPGQVLPLFLQNVLNLSAEQKKQLEGVQKEVDDRLGKVLTDEQKKQLKEPRGGFGGGPGGFRALPQPGQVLSPFLQDRLKLTAEQKKQLDGLQKDVDDKLAKLLTEEQSKQLKGMRGGFGRGGPGGPGGFGGPRPPEAVYRWEVHCLSAADGKVLWKQTAAEHKPATPISPSNTYATETPVTDGERVYAYFGMTGVFCYDLAGNLLWKADLGFYRTAFGHGSASSPALDGGRLFIQCDNDEKSFLVALDARTGKELWRTPRTERTGWSTPLVWKNSKRTEVVCVGSPRVRSYDPATGKQLWELGGMTGQVKASPAAGADLLYVGSPGGFGGAWGGPPGGGGEGGSAGGKPLFAVKAGASGDISLKGGEDANEGVAWHLPQAGPGTASPLLYEGHLYVLEDGGLLSCLDARSGKRLYRERVPGARGFTSSPWAYGGKVFCLDDAGTTHVLRAGEAFKVLGANKLGEMCWSSPAAGAGALLLRTVDHLYCIRNQSGAR
jgi:outer membrane protein assembly factor BamB